MKKYENKTDGYMMRIQDINTQARVVYIAGPMSGKPDFNRTAFSLAAVRLSAQGAIPLNPAMLPDGLSEADYMRIGLAMLQCAEGIYLLDGWQDSAAGSAEVALAKKLGLTFGFQIASAAMKGLPDA